MRLSRSLGVSLREVEFGSWRKSVGFGDCEDCCLVTRLSVAAAAAAAGEASSGVDAVAVVSSSSTSFQGHMEMEREKTNQKYV